MARWMFAVWRWGFRVHLFGRGVYVGLDRPAWFSERYGYRRVYRIGRVALEFV
jgi:hypothetical protein